jgi:hypothetical protein
MAVQHRQQGMRGIDALDGRKFWHGADELVFALGVYENGRIGIIIKFVGREGGTNADGPYPGEEIDKLTVNLTDDPLGHDELHIKIHSHDRRARGRLLDAVSELDLFDRTGRLIDQGYVQDYAEVWKWRAPTPEHLAELDARHERGRDIRRANDTVTRAGGRTRRAGEE